MLKMNLAFWKNPNNFLKYFFLMSLKCILIIKNGQSRGVLEPSFQVVFRIVTQNAIFYLFGAKIREKSVSNYR